MDKYVPVTLILKLYFHVFVTGLEATFLFTLIKSYSIWNKFNLSALLLIEKGYLMLMYLLCILKTLLQTAGFRNYTILTNNI